VPHNKIAKYTSGNQKDFALGKFKYAVSMVTNENIQIRDNALEAVRQYLTKAFDTQILGAYFLELRVHPHHILRNNKTAAGAGADRLSSGMRHSFGVVEGRAAQVKKGTSIFIVYCETDAGARMARISMRTTVAKLPCSTKILMSQIK
jgi:large subunit ribosomal protein L10e